MAGLREVSSIVPYDDLSADERREIEKKAEELAAKELSEYTDNDSDVTDAYPDDVGLTSTHLFQISAGNAPGPNPDDMYTYINYTLDDDEALAFYGYSDPQMQLTRMIISDGVSTLADFRTEKLHDKETPSGYLTKPIVLQGKGKKLIIQVLTKDTGIPIDLPLYIKKAVIAGTLWGKQVKT